ncbi:RsmB/NOP family class I SAM-dependent RNA methyltransferase [Actibacterium lipolyticum]|uniref:Ribosomal RNA small subunit methyltransferase B n=1 Tax=Actibacterium lipolyticum TaxID=1524263 RepID=A0A238KU56_9RHOB|nr:RsmB/NOP family class I SAM-dependent RNA methyltransferase [Actibacterium lipolyticum]SMX46247.1 Ribosomal RNA small subunit methyltransferase B [Actibacterium lipolyticum]
MAEGFDKARGKAVELLNLVLEEHRQMAELTGEDGPLGDMEPSERARAQRLTLTTLRNMGRADAMLKPLLRKPPPPAVHNVLRMAIVELLENGAPAHGVVNNAVAILRRNRKTQHLTGLANAVLRKASDMTPEDWAALPMQKMPGWLRGRLESTYGRAGVEAMEAAHAKGAPLDLTAKGGNGAELAEASGGQLLPTGSVRLSGPVQVSALPGYGEGEWWVQDAAAAIPAKLLNAQPGERVLDMCAAPGGKTMQMAAAGASVTALDISEHRLARLEENLARTELEAKIVVADALTWQPDEPFDAILLDAPCSATGTIRRHPDLPYVRTGKDIKPLFALQAQMLDHALEILKPGGRLVFCTCSLLPEEGENQLKNALDRHAGLHVTPITAPWVEDGWRDELGGLRLRPDMWGETGGMDGFYIAVLQKSA